ncbi:hypothetical protein BJ165DRAFT_1615979 [Panaeolus papilionaceus]|nr:hypothetical protein BJ165DRAFT_1615979 [Panaeolus papilionaceus]
MECSALNCPFKIKLSGYNKSNLIESIVAFATRQELLFNHSHDFTQLTIEHTQLQARYNELWKCYCLLVQGPPEKHSTTMDTPGHSRVALFNPSMEIPEVIPDSEPGSPFHNDLAFTGFTKRPLSKPMPQRDALTSFLESNSHDDNLTDCSPTDNSDDMGSEWATFKRGYEDRRRNAAAKTSLHTGKTPQQNRKLAKFIDKMDKKYPYTRDDGGLASNQEPFA